MTSQTRVPDDRSNGACFSRMQVTGGKGSWGGIQAESLTPGHGVSRCAAVQEHPHGLGGPGIAGGSVQVGWAARASSGRVAGVGYPPAMDAGEKVLCGLPMAGGRASVYFEWSPGSEEGEGRRVGLPQQCHQAPNPGPGVADC